MDTADMDTADMDTADMDTADRVGMGGELGLGQCPLMYVFSLEDQSNLFSTTASLTV